MPVVVCGLVADRSKSIMLYSCHIYYSRTACNLVMNSTSTKMGMWSCNEGCERVLSRTEKSGNNNLPWLGRDKNTDAILASTPA